MKKLLVILLFSLSTGVVFAQQAVTASATSLTAAEQAQMVSMPKTDWLTPFYEIKVDGPIEITFKKVATQEEARIIYDTKGNITSKFKAEIDKDGLLTIEERFDPKRNTVTEVTLYYADVREIKIAHAKAHFDEVVKRDMFDVEVSGGAVVTMDVETLDLVVSCTGRSMLTLSGNTKYLTMKVSTARLNGAKLYTVASRVDVSHNAEVRINVSERLEATTSTSAKLLYKGSPAILRDHTSVFGGDIINID